VIAAGNVVEHAFVVDDAAMQAFITLSNDRSAVHTDAAYARSRGFDGVIVYGGLMLAQLSHVLGGHIPGDHGVSTRWSIDYRRPLYVGERALLRFEVLNVSEATGLIDAKFTITCGERTIATGKTQSLVPVDDLQGKTWARS